MTYGELLEKDRPKPIKETISKDEQEIIELYKESDKQRLIKESIINNDSNTLFHSLNQKEMNVSGLSGCIQIC